MKDHSDKIIEYSLQESREQLERILADPDHDFQDTREERIINWANDLLLGAADNEPGQVNLIPPLPPSEAEKPFTEEEESDHQIIGSGSSSIRRSGKRQTFS